MSLQLCSKMRNSWRALKILPKGTIPALGRCGSEMWKLKNEAEELESKLASVEYELEELEQEIRRFRCLFRQI